MNTAASANQTSTKQTSSLASLAESGPPVEGGGQAQWSSWSRCESSFSLLLVPHRAGVFVLAEEIATVGADSRMLAVFHVAEADDLSRAVSRVFATGSELREKLLTTPCFLRYAAIDDARQRQTIAVALNRWVAEARAAAAQVAPGVGVAPPPCPNGPAETGHVPSLPSGVLKSEILVDSDPGDEQPTSVFDAAYDPPSHCAGEAHCAPRKRRVETRWRGPFPAGF